MSTSKKDTESTVTELVLKKTLHCNQTRVFRATKEIAHFDLEKRAANSDLLVTGRTLLSMAKKGSNFFRKALSYADQKWDTERCIEKDSDMKK